MLPAKERPSPGILHSTYQIDVMATRVKAQAQLKPFCDPAGDRMKVQPNQRGWIVINPAHENSPHLRIMKTLVRAWRCLRINHSRRTQRVQTLEDIDGIGQLIIILAQCGGRFGTRAVFFDLLNLVVSQTVIFK